MKKTLILIFLAIIILGCKQNKKENDVETKSIEEKLIGEWVAKAESKNVSLIFKETQHAILVVGNQAIGGESFTGDDGTKAECKFDVDESQEPMSLDLIFYDLNTKNEKGRIHGIFRFLTDTKIEFRMSFDGNSPSEFDSNDELNTAILDKKTD